jgi:2-dehydropantoate 2-reductase
MRHAILGPGGVGGLIGAALAKAGESITLIVRPEMLDLQPRELSLESKFGNFSIPVAVAAKADLPLDILWITVKATQLDAALDSVPAGERIDAVVPLLNGIDHLRILRNRFGHDAVVPATIAVETERIAPGKIVHRSPFARLNLGASGRKRLETSVQQLSRFGFECKFVDNEETLLWSKLVFLAPIALSTAAANVPIGEIIGNPTQRALLEAAVREACSVAAASRATVDPDAVIATIKSLPPTMRSSMQNDLANGRIPELDAIAGPILRGAEAHGLDASTMKALARAVQMRVAEF